MYLPIRDASALACEKTRLHMTATVLASLGWTFFFFLLAVYIWILNKFRDAASKVDELQRERDSLSKSVVRKMSEIEALRDHLESRNMLLSLARGKVAKLRQNQVFVIGDDSDSDSDSYSDSDSIGGGRDSLDVTSNTGSVFSTRLRPAPARTPTPTQAPTPVPAPTPSEESGAAKTPGASPSIAAETTEDGAQKEDESVSRPASPELVISLSEGSLAYELAVAQAGEDCASEFASPRPSTEVR